MGTIHRSIAAALAAASLAACDGSSDSPTPPPALQGFFAGCRNESGPDTFDAYALEGDRIRYRSYAGSTTADRTCGGIQHLATAYEGRFELGAAIPVPHLDPLAPSSLTARAIDVHLDRGGTAYGLVYLQPGTPEVLYTGDRSGARNGSSPALRPDRLAGNAPRARIPAPAAWPAIAAGTWRACRNDGGSDFTEVVAIDGAGALIVRNYGFASTGLACAGAPTVAGGADGTYVLRPDADPAGAVTVGGGPVAVTGAHALDVTFVGTTTARTAYAIAWVDELSAPESLHLGDDEGRTRGDTSGARMRVLQPLARHRAATPAAPVYTVAGMAGTYEKCRHDAELAKDIRTRVVLGAAATDNFTMTSWSYASTDRTCAGSEAVVEGPVTSTYAFRTTATATGTGTMLGGTAKAFPVVTHLADFSAPMPATLELYVDHLSGRQMLYFEKPGFMDYIGTKLP